MTGEPRVETITPQDSEQPLSDQAVLKRPDLKMGDELCKLGQALGLSEAECEIFEPVREAAEPIRFD
ncbi:MAG: hypothetical protein WA154_07400 [Moraxellaceae bacterium]